MPPLSFNNNALARLFEVRQGLNYLLNELDILNLHITELEAEIKMLSRDSCILQGHIHLLTRTLHPQPSTTCAATISRWIQKNDASRRRIGKTEAKLARTEGEMAGHVGSIKTLRERGKIIEEDVQEIRRSKVYMFAIADSMCYIRIAPLHEQDLAAILSQIST
ncbi:hypothetical protein JMJ35_000566 [Cladonia borealis]|uniref:Uncharacterized protein n=1 Tax=Cladonia borealis TaxID=184061 RepID=A0AA39RAS4_9LECA|nr:hypothetical protein JMJ35_000566 [Cladonia borealis]